jgi:hypothetical protein
MPITYDAYIVGKDNLYVSDKEEWKDGEVAFTEVLDQAMILHSKQNAEYVLRMAKYRTAAAFDMKVMPVTVDLNLRKK